ncbi:MAG: hypothetical protein V3V33_15905 [Candidatus Lokiarchaeia archaeon]
MNYPELKEIIFQKTKKLIENEKWDEILHILQVCPEQIYFFRKLLEDKFKVSKELNEFPVEKIIYETNSQDDPNAPFIYYKFTEIFSLIFEVLNYESEFLSRNFKVQLCRLLYPKITEFLKYKRNRISSIERFIENLYDEINQFYHDDFINHSFLLEYLNKEKPEFLVEFFPKIFSKGSYRLGYELIIKFNKLIKRYDSETRQILKNIIIYEKQYYSLKELLEGENKELLQIMEDSRRRKKGEFYNKFVNYTKETIENKLFERNPDDIFRYTFDLYTEEELTNIIKKIIELEINYSHMGNQLGEHGWVHLLLLEIAWAKKSNLFDDYLDDLVKLGHLQAVQTYFAQFPEKLKKYQDFLFEKLGFFIINLLQWHYDDFKFNDPECIFRELLFKELPAEALTSIFFKKQPELINQFKKIIKDYIDIKLKEDSVEIGLFYKLESLLRIYYRACDEYNHKPNIDIGLLKEVYEYFVSKSIFKEGDSFIHNIYLAKNFNQLDEKLQEVLIKQLIESKNLSSIDFLLNYGYKHMERYIDLIITFDPKHDLQSQHFIRILEKIARESGNNKQIQDKIQDRLKDEILIYKTAEIYSFLGDFKKSEWILEQILDNEVIISNSINSFIDYQLVRIESSILNSSQFNTSERISELSNIESDFNKFNTNQSLLQNFKFKLNSYKARINLYDGFSYMEEKLFQRSKDSFERASEIYSALKETHIKPDNKKIFNVLFKISDFFASNLMDISNFTLNDELNSIIHRKLITPFSIQQEVNIQMKRLLENIKLLKFSPNLKLTSQLICEIPTKFCPIPPKIIKKRLVKKSLLDNKEEILIEWDKENNKIKNNEPILISDSSQQYYFKLEFENKEKYFDFDISFNPKSNVKIYCEGKESSAGIINYELSINSLSFKGNQDIELSFTETDICGYKESSFFVIKHHDIHKLEEEIIDEICSKITKYKEELYPPIRFKIFLEQFEDPIIRFNFLKYILYRVKDYYYTFNEMRQAIVKQIEKLPYGDDDKLIFIILNELQTKSQMFWSYFTNHYLEVPNRKIRIMESNKVPKYLSEYSAENRLFLIFIDDVIGTGTQFIKFYKNDFHRQYEKYITKKNSKFNFYLVAGVGSEESFEYISKNSLISESHIRYSRIIRKNEKAFNKENWNNEDDLESVKDYLKKIHPEKWGGYKGLEYLVVLEWNTPNNTIGCLYKKNDKWKPLFPRK